MADLPLLDPKEIVLTSRKGVEKTFIVSEMPALTSRKVAALWLPSALPKIGDYVVNEQMCEKMMEFVEVVPQEGPNIRLKTKALIENHTDFKTLAELEKAMIDHNYGFFLQGTLSTLFQDISQKAQALIGKILMDSSAQSSQKELPPSTN